MIYVVGQVEKMLYIVAGSGRELGKTVVRGRRVDKFQRKSGGLRPYKAGDSGNSIEPSGLHNEVTLLKSVYCPSVHIVFVPLGELNPNVHL